MAKKSKKDNDNNNAWLTNQEIFKPSNLEKSDVNSQQSDTTSSTTHELNQGGWSIGESYAAFESENKEDEEEDSEKKPQLTPKLVPKSFKKVAKTVLLVTQMNRMMEMKNMEWWSKEESEKDLEDIELNEGPVTKLDVTFRSYWDICQIFVILFVYMTVIIILISYMYRVVQTL